MTTSETPEHGKDATIEARIREQDRETAYWEDLFEDAESGRSGDFWKSFFDTWCRADMGNRARLTKGFPEWAEVYQRWHNQVEGRGWRLTPRLPR